MVPFNKPLVRIEKGGLEARIVLVPQEKDPPGSGFWRPSVAEIEVILREEGVNAPLDQAAVSQGLDMVANGVRVEVIVAKGRGPEPGKDGWLEVLVDLSGPIPPAQDEVGHVDLRSTSLIRNVKAGQPLAMVHPPAAGKAGLDVRGKIIPSKPGKNFEPRFGANVQRAPQDPNLLVAATEGHARLQDGRLVVEECFQVGGDVDYASGNIAFAKSVQIAGDVKAGFTVEAGGDVEVQGMVEDCIIKAEGGVFIRGGFTGSGKGLIESKGEVTLAHLRNQTVRCESHLTVAKESINGRVQCRGKVVVNGLLAGGRIQAMLSIQCMQAGTETGTLTLLEAGFDYTAAEEMAAIRKELGEMGRYATKLEDGLKHLHDLERINRGLERWSIEMVFESERMKDKVDSKIAALRDRFSVLEDKAGDGQGAVIVVRKKAYPGTVIKIGPDMFRVEEVLEGPRSFRSRQGLIEMRSEGAGGGNT